MAQEHSRRRSILSSSSAGITESGRLGGGRKRKKHSASLPQSHNVFDLFIVEARSQHTLARKILIRIRVPSEGIAAHVPGPLGDIVSFYGPVLWRMTFSGSLQPFRNQSSKMVLPGNATERARTKVQGEGLLLEIMRQPDLYRGILRLPMGDELGCDERTTSRCT
jgi:hypothetical protein